MRSSIRIILLSGFIASLIIIASLFLYGFSSFQGLLKGTEEIVNKNNAKSEMVVAMVTSARERVLNMYAMVTSDDPFVRDDLFMDFNKQAAIFINARKGILELNLTDKEKLLLEEQGKLTGVALPIQNEIVDLVQRDEIVKAKNLLNDKGVEAQNLVLEKLGELLEVQQNKTRGTVEQIGERYQTTKKLILIWAIATCLIGGVVAAFVISRVSGIEHRLFDESEKARATLGSISDAIIRVDKDGSIVFFNETAEKMLGEGLEKQQVDEVLPFVNIRELFDETIVQTNKLGRFKVEAVSKILWVEILQESIRNEFEQVVGKVLVLHDQTDLIKAQNKLEQSNIELERRVLERTENLQLANKQLKASIDSLAQAQEQLVHSEKMAALGGLVAGISHEINTPVGISVTSATNIEEKIHSLEKQFLSGELTKSGFEEYMLHTQKGLEILVSNLNRASELIRSFKQVAVDQSSDELRSFDLREYCDEIILSLHPNLKKTSIIVKNEVPENIELYTNPGAVYQIMSNLIMNSIIHAFSDDNKDAEISISANTGDKLTLIYKDNGRGLDNDALAKIFEPFFTTRRGQGGSGLGMNVVYNLATTTLKGEIVARSEPGEGLEVLIEFPVNQEVAA